MTALLRWATAGCVGAVALAVVFVAVQPATEAQRETRSSLERSGVRVVEPAANSGDAFEDPSALALALASLVFGLAAGVAFGAATDRFGHLALFALGGCAVAVGVLAVADRSTWRDVGAQTVFWLATARRLWWSGRGEAVRGAARPRP